VKRSDLIRTFDRQARWYEKKRRRQELKAWRQKLLHTAKGNVLEVAVGAGANFPYYPPDALVTAVDFSPEMLKKAKQAADECGMRATFIQSDVESLNFPPDSFDTVVSTLSLCGYDDPCHVLSLFNRWCKKDGRILLMEHGISSNPALAVLQKALDPLAYRLIGCHQKRDMMRIIQSSGICIEKAEHYFANVVHLVWAKPNKR
jgi:ubiquinone/menaquinone biosynthesis C-methylase UbiE